jgi:hypothetical protein
MRIRKRLEENGARQLLHLRVDRHNVSVIPQYENGGKHQLLELAQ